MPTVSILLTCYNHRRYLPACVEGIRAQTFTDYEIIALDDGSTDGTREWLREHCSDWKLVFHERNLGTYGSLNEGLRRATGEFVAVLNDDDVWRPRKLERQLELMREEPGVGLVHTNGHFIDAEGRPLQGEPLGWSFPRIRSGDILLDLVYANKIIASAALVRKECFDVLGGFDPSYYGSGDWEMWLRIAERYLVGYVDEPLTLYRWHGENASFNLEKVWRDDERLREWIRERAAFWTHCDPKKLRRALAHNWACLGTLRALDGRPREARRAYLESLRLAPWRLKSVLRILATFLPRSFFRSLR